MNKIELFEYQSKLYSEISEEPNCNCCSSDFADFEKYLEKNKLDKVFSFTSRGIKANHFVGVIKYKHHQIQILPKLCKDEKNSENIIKNLIYMLSYTKKLDIKTTNYADLSKNKNPFLEILIREYATTLFDCLKRLTPKNYVREEENLNYLKGKLKFSENIRYNCTNQAKFYCEYDEFSENNLLNQLFLFVSKGLYAISSDNKNKKLLNFIINYYCDVDLVRIDKFKVEKIRLNRNQELFKRPLDLAKLFIENSSIDLSKNRIENIAIIWDMNVLFEEYICEFIRKNREYLEIEDIIYQKGKRLLTNTTNHQTYGNTFADAYIKYNDKNSVILDTKYKPNKGEVNAFSNSDVFQVMTYCQLHDSKAAILLYPYNGEQNKSTEELINEFKLNVSEGIEPRKLTTAVVDLRCEFLKNDEYKIKDQLKIILEKGKLCQTQTR